MSLIIPVAMRAGNNIIPPPFSNNSILSISLDAANNSFVGGAFTTLNGFSRNSIGKILENQNLDLTFNPGTNQTVLSIYYDSSTNKIYVGGSFSNAASTSSNFIARLNNDSTGTYDSFFTSFPNNVVNGLYVDSLGEVYISGNFTSIGGVARSRIASYNSSGGLRTFQANANNTVNKMITDPSSTSNLIISGNFSLIRGVARRGLAKVAKGTGALTTFNANAVLQTTTNLIFMDVNSGGSIFVGGRTTSAYNGDNILKLSSSGALLITYNVPRFYTVLSGVLDSSDNVYSCISSLTVTDHRMYKFDASGNPDATFNGTGYISVNGPIFSMKITSTGNIVVCGGFTVINGVSRNNYAVIDSTSAVL